MLPPDEPQEFVEQVMSKHDEPASEALDLEELAKAVLELLKQEIRISNERVGRRNYP